MIKYKRRKISDFLFYMNIESKIEELKKTKFGGQAYLDLHLALQWLEQHPNEKPPYVPASQINAFALTIYKWLIDKSSSN